jgi:Uma2 family endonuclease
MVTSKLTTADESEPTWEVAHLFPPQGHWTETEFFDLHSNRMVELVDGMLEILPMPTWLHQLFVDYLCELLKRSVREAGIGGRVLPAPLPVRLFPKTVREPDVMYFAPGSEPDNPRSYPSRLDLALEVVSEGADAHRRDYDDKRRDYAKARVPEYWIVDPEEKRILVLVLDGEAYRAHGDFGPGDVASGRLIRELKVDIDQLMKLAEQPN